MSAKLAEALAAVADLHNQMAEAYTALSVIYDTDSSKSGDEGDDGPARKVSNKGGKAAVASKKGSGKAAAVEEEDDELPEPKAAVKKGGKSKAKATEDDVRQAAKALLEKLGEKAGKAKVVEILGGKLSEVDEGDYADKIAELEAAAEEEDI